MVNQTTRLDSLEQISTQLQRDITAIQVKLEEQREFKKFVLNWMHQQDSRSFSRSISHLPASSFVASSDCSFECMIAKLEGIISRSDEHSRKLLLIKGIGSKSMSNSDKSGNSIGQGLSHSEIGVPAGCVARNLGSEVMVGHGTEQNNVAYMASSDLGPLGLKKVTDDMKTKNRTDRAGFVSSGEKEHRKSAPSGAKVGPPKFELVMGRKWVVEYQIGVKDLLIDDCDPRQTVYIFGCKDSVLQIKGKVNNITVDKCTKMGVVFTDVVAAFEIVNCSSVEVQCQGAAPTISIDNTAGCQLYLSKDSLESSITTSKASEVNVMVPAQDPDADLAEHPMPHQYIHTYQDGHFVTTPVAHSGA